MRNTGYDHRSFVCQTCGTRIDGTNYYTRFKCRRCYNAAHRAWVHGKSAKVDCSYNCLECELPDCILPGDYPEAEWEGAWAD